MSSLRFDLFTCVGKKIKSCQTLFSVTFMLKVILECNDMSMSTVIQRDFEHNCGKTQNKSIMI